MLKAGTSHFFRKTTFVGREEVDRREEKRMQTLVQKPQFTDLVNRSWRKASSVRAFSSSSSKADYTNQSRGGLPRFYSEVLPSSKGSIVRVVGDEFKHMTKVLRLIEDDRVELFNGKGGVIEGCIETIDRTGLNIMALEDPKQVLPKNNQWHVFAAFGSLKGSRAGWLVEKCTENACLLIHYDGLWRLSNLWKELGASSLTPLLTERSPSISDNRVDRLQRVSLAAVKQCQRLHEMTMNPPTKISKILPTVSQSKQSFLAVAEAPPLISTLSLSSKEASGLIIVGPEGDFTEEEVKMMTEAGATPVGLGPHRLRVETATMALLATLMLWSDSQQSVDL